MKLCGRVARVIEYDPAYCDTIVARYRASTGKVATLGANGPTFEQVASQRHFEQAVSQLERYLEDKLLVSRAHT